MKLSRYVAFLRSMYLLYQNAHWQCHGPNFYSLHLLFERLYKNVSKDVDDAAELSAALLSYKVLDLTEQIKYFQEILSEIGQFDDFLQAGLAGESAFIKMSENFIAELESANKLTSDLKTMLEQNIKNSKSRMYLLKQSIS